MRRHRMVFRSVDSIRRANLQKQSSAGAVLAGSAADREFDASHGHFDGKCVAVTSLNPNPARWDRQLRCLESWQRFGLQVIAVNTREELDRLQLPAGVTGLACDTLATIYDRPTQLITTLLRAGAATGLPTLLINSDIELHGPVSVLDDALNYPDRLGIGVRYNHDAHQPRSAASREPYGLDVFLVTPELIRDLDDAPFSIGKPVWDYWFPHWARSHGVKFHWIEEPCFFHESHPLGWTPHEWHIGNNAFGQQYGVSLGYDSPEFRRNLDLNV